MEFQYLPVASVLHNEEDKNNIISEYSDRLNSLGGACIKKWNEFRNIPLCFFVATGGTEETILEIWEHAQDAFDVQYIVLIAHPFQNSLPAALEMLARFGQLGVPGEICYLEDAEDDQGFKKLVRIIKDVNVFNELRNSRLGCIGTPSSWLVASTPHAAALKKLWGVELVSIGMEPLYEEIENASKEDAEKLIDKFNAAAAEKIEPSIEDQIQAARVYLGLKKVVEKNKLNAVTIRCFDLVDEKNTTGCYALSLLNDEGITAGCEGDMVSALGLMWTKKLLGEMSWMANPAQVNVGTNTLTLAHCTVPCSLLDTYTIRSHFESSIGMAIQGNMRRGDVTLLRIGGIELDKLWIAEGTIVSTSKKEQMCRTQIDVKLHSASVQELLTDPLGNHLIVVPGRHMRHLYSWWRKIIKGHPSKE